MKSFIVTVLLALTALPSLAGVYRYPISGNTGNPKDEFVLVVDTDSAAFQDRIAWIGKQVTTTQLAPPVIRDLFNAAPGVANANPTSEVSITTYGVACWQRNSAEACLDVRAVATGTEGPMHCLAVLNAVLDLGMDPNGIRHLRYTLPSPPSVDEDYKAPGSPLGEPLVAGQSVKYKSRNLGNREGDTWTGPSGATYRFTNVGGIFRYMVWVRQGNGDAAAP